MRSTPSMRDELEPPETYLASLAHDMALAVGSGRMSDGCAALALAECARHKPDMLAPTAYALATDALAADLLAKAAFELVSPCCLGLGDRGTSDT